MERRAVPTGTLAACLAAGLAFTALAAAVFRPTWSELAGTLPAANGSSADALLLTWATTHVTRALLAHPTTLFDAGIFHPLHGTLALGDHMIGQALVGLPVWLATGNPLLEYNLSSLAAYVTAATAMFAYARTVVGGGAIPALAAGVVFAFTPFRFAAPLWLQLLWTAFVPLALLAWLRFVATRSAWAWLAWVGCWSAQGLMGQYVALYFTLVMGAVGAVALVAAPARRDPRLWIGTLAAPLAMGVVLWPTAAPYLALRAAQGTIRSGGVDTPLAILWPGAGTLLARVWPHANAFGPGASVAALALGGLALGARGATPRLDLPGRFVWLVHAVGLAATLLLVFVPMRWQHALPGLDMTRNTNRALVVGLCFVAALVAAAVRWVAARGSRGHLAALGLLVLLLADMGTPPRERRPFPTAATLTPTVRHLATLPPDTIVYQRGDLPDAIARSMYDALFHHHRMPVGYSGFTPPGGDYVIQRLATFPSPGAARLLRALGVGAVVLPAPTDADVARAGALGARVDGRFDGDVVLDVRSLPATPPPPPARPLPARGLHVTAASGAGDVARVLDGDPATTWIAPPLPGVAPTLTVDLGAPRTLAGVRLVVPAAHAASAFRTEVAVSDDGTRWTPLDAVFEPDDLDRFLHAPPAHVGFTARFPPTPARRVRLTNPYLAGVQQQLRSMTEAATRLGLSLDAGWRGEWELDELQVLTPATDTAPRAPGETAG